MRISYDHETDVLYLRFEEVDDGCDYIEPTPGAVLRVDSRTGRIVGCTILDFQERIRKAGKEIAQKAIAARWGNRKTQE